MEKLNLWADLTVEEQREWEAQEMEQPVNFATVRIDPAPFQLVEKTSILKVTRVLIQQIYFHLCGSGTGTVR